MSDSQQMAEAQAEVAEQAVVAVEAPATTEAAIETAEASVSTTPQTEPAKEPELSNEDLLARLGIKKDEFEQFQKAQKEKKEAEEKPLNDAKKWAKITSYGIENGKVTKDDVVSFEILSSKSDFELVLEDFKKDFTYSEEELSEDEKAEELDLAFKSTYHLDSEGRAKAKGEILIKAEANELRKEIASKIQNVEREYLTVESLNELKKSQKEIFDRVSASSIKDSVEVDGVKIDYEIPFAVSFDETKDILSKDGAVFLDVMHSLQGEDAEAASKMYENFVTQLAKEKAQKEALTNAIWEKAKEHFREKYSVGAKAPFKQGDPAIVEKQAGGLTEKEYLEKRHSY